MDFRLLNGAPKVTLIESFSGEVLLIPPTRDSKIEFSTIHEARDYVVSKNWEIHVVHLHGLTPIIRDRVGKAIL